jgi:hypothetical protein
MASSSALVRQPYLKFPKEIDTIRQQLSQTIRPLLNPTDLSLEKQWLDFLMTALDQIDDYVTDNDDSIIEIHNLITNPNSEEIHVFLDQTTSVYEKIVNSTSDDDDNVDLIITHFYDALSQILKLYY